jgi:Icc protein
VIPGNDGGHLAETELEYIEKNVDDNGLHYMLVLHHQPIPCGCSWLDTMILDNSADFISLISSKPAIRAVINGHIHQSNQQDIGGISFISSPSTCFQFTPQTSQFSLDSCMPGYRRLTLNDDGSIETEVVRLADFDLNLEHTQSGY